MSPTTCPKCGRPVDAVPGEPVNFCTWCGSPGHIRGGPGADHRPDVTGDPGRYAEGG